MQSLFRKISFEENLIRPKSYVERTENPKPRKPNFLWAVFGVVVFGSIFFAAITNLENLSPERLEKLMGLFKKFDEEAEQYVLVALKSELYPCPSCIGKDSVFLLEGEVWKYGVSVNGESGRYTKSFLKKMNLHYSPQFIGSLTDCYKQEKLQIFTYPTLPENIKRGHKKLFRPPGNPTD